MKWPSVTIMTPDGPKSAIAPVIISASRSTDIPAFHSEWFADRLKAGYCRWVNPFSRRPQYVSFENVRAIVFWTKNAAPILPILRDLDARGITHYFQFTLNDYEAEGLEPNVPPLAQRIETFRRLSELIGKERVIWRFDPLILAGSLTPQTLVDRIQCVGRALHAFTDKLVISFADISIYAKVQRSLKRHAVSYREFRPEDMHEVAKGAGELARQWRLEVASCCEAIDLSMYGIQHNRCIDDELLLRISGNDPELVRLFSPASSADGGLFGGGDSAGRAKDAGQRDGCGCVISKDIGAYNTCPHLCVYCYANMSASAVQKALSDADGGGESIGR